MAILKKLSLRYISKQYPDNNQGTSCASTDSHGDGPHRYHKEICEEKTGEQKEDQEEVEIDANKKEIQKTKQCDVYITRNVVRLAQQAEETGCDTVMRLRKQKEHLHSIERNLSLISVQTDVAEGNAKELKMLNKSMFATRVRNPFAKVPSNGREISAIQQKRDALRRAAWEVEAQDNNSDPATSTVSVDERCRYQFEADSEDDEMENEIDGNLGRIRETVRKLNYFSRVIGEELDGGYIHDIDTETVRIDDKMAEITERFRRIK